jgi:hypothetical protein
MGVFEEPFPSNDCLCWLHTSCLEQICHNVSQGDASTGLGDGERVVDKMVGSDSTGEVDCVG